METLSRECTSCQSSKPETDFRMESHGKVGRMCKQCNREKSSAWRAANRDRFLAQMREAYDPDRARDYTLRKKYGITLDAYKSMCAERMNRCEICVDEPRDGILRVDHCHKTGAIRGLLCDTCNRGIGLLKDDAMTLRSAVSYLTRSLTTIGPA